MDDLNTPINVIICNRTATEGQTQWLNQMTRDLGQLLENHGDIVKSVSYCDKEILPKNAKMVEAVFAQQVILTLIPVVTPWVLDKIHAGIKALVVSGKNVYARVQAGSYEMNIGPETTLLDLAKMKQRIKSSKENFPENRFALIIANSDYHDKRLPGLKSPMVDAKRLSEVLVDSEIGGFGHIETLIDESSDIIMQAIESHYANRQVDDLLLTYFSGHGIRDKNGQLFLAVKNTMFNMLKSTGVSAHFLKEIMDESMSQKQLLILDCCYSGAIVEGAKSEQVIGQSVNSTSLFQSSGFGRVIITASDSMQFAYDGQQIEGNTNNSAFTHHLIEGLKTGSADIDNDGLISVDELYQYAYQKVIPKQSPNISSLSQRGQIIIARNPNQIITPAKLPESVTRAMSSEDRLHRQGAVSELATMLKSNDPSVVMAAGSALRRMTDDDSRSVSSAANDILSQVVNLKPSRSSLNLPPPIPPPQKTVDTYYTAFADRQRNNALAADENKSGAASLYSTKRNTSGQGKDAIIPEQIKGWNWGAFLLSFFWSIGNSTWIGLFSLVPYLGCIMAIALGIKGNEWAWRNKKWDSIEHFQRTQKIWARFGFILLAIGLFFGFIIGFLEEIGSF